MWKTKTTKRRISLLIAFLAFYGAYLGLFAARNIPLVEAADSDFSDGITVDSTLDAPDADGGTNGTCDDGSGNCTFRAALQEANNNADLSTIEFNISGSGVHTITLGSILPDITEQTVIDGYSEPGASPNTAMAPNPLTGTLTVEINGSGVGSSNPILRFSGNADDSELHGVVLNNSQGGAIVADADNVIVAGNYIGTNAAGTAAATNNGPAITTNNASTDVQLGGLTPAERNLISGNEDGSYPNTRWVIQGNYVGVAKDGVTAIPNSTNGGSGAFSIDNCSDTQVGGTQAGAVNVVSGNNSHGIAPDNSPGTKIEGNLVGTDYTGLIAVPNGSGIVISGDQTGSSIGGSTSAARNIVSGNTIAGILSGSTSTDDADRLSITGNYVGLDINGTNALPNGVGILASGSDVIGGTTSERNVVAGNTYFNVSLQGLGGPQSDSRITGNYIGTNAAGNIDGAITAVQGEGIRISALANDNLISGNRIAGNRGSGVAVRSYNVTGAIPNPYTPTNIAILGNEIYDNVAGGPTPGEPGLGIDLYQAVASSFTFPADVIDADTYNGFGTNLNDVDDADTSSTPDYLPNAYMNHPILNSAIQNGTNLSVNLDLDAADTTDTNGNYRIEFFANNAADDSGYGEGQTFLGSALVSNGTNKTASLTLLNGTDLTGKVLSATTTAINNTTESGYGATSEFSPTEAVQVLSAATNTSNGNLANTGQKVISMAVLSSLFILSTAGATHIARKRLSYTRISR